MQKSLLGHRVKSRSSRKIDRRCIPKAELAKRKRKIPKGSRVCMRCKQRRPISAFYITFSKTGQRRTECYICANKRVRVWKRKHPNYMRAYRIKEEYGLSRTEYNALFKKHKFRCAICRMSAKENGKKLAVDHDHNTGAIRGVLCHRCNTGLGFLRDNINLLLNAVKYLRNCR